MLSNLALVISLILMILPALYGLHLYALMVLAASRWRRVSREQAHVRAAFVKQASAADWPVITTQIPLYNERSVAERVMLAVAAQDYPRERHGIQVLDDSTDETREIVERVATRLQAEGHDVRVIRRPERTHFKAGALAFGLRQARGEFVAVFDADFLPPRDYLSRLVPLLAARPEAGCVQGRWGHLNLRENWMTEALSIGIDGHFGVEQPARGWNGFLINFNGTGGIWRRQAIDDPRVGGWSGDTITEDLDLSYRAQLAGWKIVYCPAVVAPGEVPADVDAIKAQQRRWATGSIQTSRKLLPGVWHSNLTLLQKLEASVHLTQYSVNLLMLLMPLVARPLATLAPMPSGSAVLAITSTIVLVGAAAPSIAYVCARWLLGERLPSLWGILKLIMLGLGLSLNNSVAVLAGLRQRGGEFVRTPKSGSTSASAARESTYRAARSRLWIAELALGAICLAQWAAFLKADHYVGGTFLLLYGIGLLRLGWGSRPAAARRTSASGRNEKPALPAADRVAA